MRKLFFVSCLFLALSSVSQADSFSEITGIKVLDGVKYPFTGRGLQRALADAISSSTGGEVWVPPIALSSITITSTIVIGRNSPTNIPVTLRIFRGAVVNVNITDGSDAFELSDGSAIIGPATAVLLSPQAQFILSNKASIGNLFRALSQDASQNSMDIEKVGVDGNCSGGARIASGAAIFDYSELFNNSTLRDVFATGYCASSGQAWGIKVQTKPGATDGAGRILFDNTTLYPTGPNAGWLLVDGTPNSTVYISGIEIRSPRWEMNGNAGSGLPQISIISGANNHIRSVYIQQGELVVQSPPSGYVVAAINGCYGCSVMQMAFDQSGTVNSTLTLLSLGNAASQLNYGFSVYHINALSSASVGTWVNDLRTGIAIPNSGICLTHYAQENASTFPAWLQRTTQNPLGTFSSLPICNSGSEGTRVSVTDSTTATYGALITGGGANHVPAYCNGTNWVVD